MPAKRALGAFTPEDKVELVACGTVVECYDIMIDTAVALLLYINVRDTHILIVSFLKAVELQAGIVSDKSLYDLCAKEVAVVGSMVAEEELCLSTLVEDDEYAAVHHKVDIRAEDIDDLNATISLGVLGNIDEESVLSSIRGACGGICGRICCRIRAGFGL